MTSSQAISDNQLLFLVLANETIVVPEPAVPQMPLPLPQGVQVAPENPLHSVQLQFTPEQVADSISLTATPLEEPEPLPVPVAPEIAPEPVNDTTQGSLIYLLVIIPFSTI